MFVQMKRLQNFAKGSLSLTWQLKGDWTHAMKVLSMFITNYYHYFLFWGDYFSLHSVVCSFLILLFHL